MASLYSLFGVSVFWVRLLTALCGVAAIVAVFRLGMQLFSTRVAVLGAGIFATTRYRPVRRLARRIEMLEADQEGTFRAGYLKMASPSLAFYLNQPILELFSLDEAAVCLSSTTRTYLLVDESDLEALQAQATSDTFVAATSPRLSTNFRSFRQALRSDRWKAREA